jgi:ubiquitin carboxyl-terminal hydrolase 7
LVAKNGVIADVLQALQKKTKLDDATIRQVRIYEAHNGKVHKELNPEHSVVGVGDYVQLYAEKIPEEELKAEENDKFINAFHFQKEPSKPHGVPFKFLVKPVSTITFRRNGVHGAGGNADCIVGRTL